MYCKLIWHDTWVWVVELPHVRASITSGAYVNNLGFLVVRVLNYGHRPLANHIDTFHLANQCIWALVIPRRPKFLTHLRIMEWHERITQHHAHCLFCRMHFLPPLLVHGHRGSSGVSEQIQLKRSGLYIFHNIPHCDMPYQFQQFQNPSHVNSISFVKARSLMIQWGSLTWLKLINFPTLSWNKKDLGVVLHVVRSLNV